MADRAVIVLDEDLGIIGIRPRPRAGGATPLGPGLCQESKEIKEMARFADDAPAFVRVFQPVVGREFASVAAVVNPERPSAGNVLLQLRGQWRETPVEA